MLKCSLTITTYLHTVCTQQNFLFAKHYIIFSLAWRNTHYQAENTNCTCYSRIHLPNMWQTYIFKYITNGISIRQILSIYPLLLFIVCKTLFFSLCPSRNCPCQPLNASSGWKLTCTGLFKEKVIFRFFFFHSVVIHYI